MSFDLNIQNYQKMELEEIFDLPQGYNSELVEVKNIKLQRNIMLNKNIEENLKPRIIEFLNEAKQLILAGFSKVDHLKDTYSNVYNLDKSLKPTDVIADGGTFIIQKPATPFGQSRPSEFYGGVINPLANRILRKNLNIDTRFRDNYYTTSAANFHLDIPARFTQVVSLQLASLELPTTFYSISKVFGNHFFVIEINDDIKQVIIIPDGNYTPLGLVTFLNDTMASFTTSLLQYIYFTIDNDNGNGSGKMIVGISSNYSGDLFSFSLDFATDRDGNEDRNTPLPLKLGWIFGFREGYYINNSVYVSEGLVDLQGLRYIYLVVDDFNNNVNDGFYGAFNSSLLNKNILARISLQGSVFKYLSENNFALVTYARQYFGPVDIQKLQIQLLDEYGRILDLNNMDYSFCLTFQSIYDL